MKIKNRKTRIIGVVLLIILIIVVLFVRAHIRIQNGDLVKWEGKWYTKEELKDTFPPQYIEVPAKNTPEEVYATFRQALLDNDIEKALGEIREENREEYRKAFEDKEKFEKWVKSLPEKISNLRIDGNFGYYDWDKGDRYKHTIYFRKNEYGYWQIKII
ncbi:hypothetical protein KJ557_00920 [Patescibacteria group bacterium]|nr:hypothetical protein [Patescibacteria group bacterium]